VVIKSLATLKSESQFADATVANSGDGLTYPAYSTTGSIYTFTLPVSSNIEFIGGGSNQVEIIVYDSSYEVVYTITKDNGSVEGIKWKSEETKAGTYYISVRGISINNYSDFSGIKFNIYPIVTNIEAGNAETVTLPYEGDSATVSWVQSSNNGTRYTYYYKLIVPEKAYYHVDLAAGSSATLYKGTSTSGEVIAKTTDFSMAANEVLLDKGTYLFAASGVTNGNEYTITIKSRDFKDIKKLTGVKEVNVYKGDKKNLTINMDPVDNESTIKYTGALTGYDSDNKEYTPKNKPLIVTDKLGTFTGTATTSEGVVYKVKVNVKPGPTQINEAVATTTSKKKAKLVLNWKDTGNFYKLHQKVGKKWKVIKTTTKNKITINTKANKKFTIKIEACYKKGNKIVNSSMGKAVNVFTAPAKMAKIKSVKQKGKTVYTAPYRHRYIDSKGWPFYVTEGNVSSASVVIKYKKVKGAKYYEPSSGKKDAINNQWIIKNNLLSYGYKGKLSTSKTEKVKIRPVYMKGVCTAYGPWSKQKKVKISPVK